MLPLNSHLNIAGRVAPAQLVISKINKYHIVYKVYFITSGSFDDVALYSGVAENRVGGPHYKEKMKYREHFIIQIPLVLKLHLLHFLLSAERCAEG